MFYYTDKVKKIRIRKLRVILCCPWRTQASSIFMIPYKGGYFNIILSKQNRFSLCQNCVMEAICLGNSSVGTFNVGDNFKLLVQLAITCLPLWALQLYWNKMAVNILEGNNSEDWSIRFICRYLDHTEKGKDHYFWLICVKV